MATCGDSAEATCAQCANRFQFQIRRGPKPVTCPDCKAARNRAAVAKYWSTHNRRRYREPQECAQCGTETTKRTYCSRRCSELARARRKGVQAWADRYPADRPSVELKQCVICDTAFARKSAGRDAGLCCSRYCGFELQRQRKALFFEVSRERKIYARWSRRLKQASRPIRDKSNRCRDCAVVVEKHAQRCPQCREQAEKRNKLNAKRSPSARAAKARRKAIERGRLEGAERFDPIEVLKRDGWRCHLCGCKTPERLRGTCAPNAPELDHIIPLAKGGQHTRANTACACRRCNGAKSDRIVGQPSLLALVA